MESPANVQAVVKDGVQFIPLRNVVEQLGGSISWNNESKAATFTVREVTGQIWADNNTFQANGQSHILSGQPFVQDGTLYVPIDTLHDIGLTTG